MQMISSNRMNKCGGAFWHKQKKTVKINQKDVYNQEQLVEKKNIPPFFPLHWKESIVIVPV